MSVAKLYRETPGGDPGPGADPVLVELFDYADTTEFLDDPNDWWGDEFSIADQQLFVGDGVEGNNRCWQLTWPARPDGTGCSDYSVGRDLTFPDQYQHVWIEAWTKFSANFATDPGYTCVPGRTPALKYGFILGPSPLAARLASQLGAYQLPNQAFTFSIFGSEPDVEVSMTGNNVFDGQWHRWRFYGKLNAVDVGTGLHATWLDSNRLHYHNADIVADYFNEFSITRNMNLGPQEECYLRVGATRVWSADPGWGLFPANTADVAYLTQTVVQRTTFVGDSFDVTYRAFNRDGTELIGESLDIRSNNTTNIKVNGVSFITSIATPATVTVNVVGAWTGRRFIEVKHIEPSPPRGTFVSTLLEM